jgi:methionyl-tRNA formyltransferase
MAELKIIFMGTPEFAVASLRQLIENKYDVAAVVTVPDKPAGRGLKLKESAVKSFAMTHGIPVLQPVNLKSPEFISQLKTINANLFVIVAFRKLPDEVWMMPQLGTFNLHASLLPQYRGAAPINHAVINGESMTGVTTFFLNSGIDKGRIIMNRQLSIGQDETAGELHDRLMITGAELVIETVKAISDETCKTIDQPENTDGLKPAPRIFREHCRIDWTKSTRDVHNLIRGLSPYPGAYSTLKTIKGTSEIKIIRSIISQTLSKETPGKALILDGSKLLISCTDGFIEITQLQPAGKKAMATVEFLRGNKSDILKFEI